MRLQNELVDNVEKLFVFVVYPEVESTRAVTCSTQQSGKSDSRRLFLFSRPDGNNLEHLTSLVVKPDDVLGHQPDGLDPIEQKPPPDALPVVDEKCGAEAGQFGYPKLGECCRNRLVEAT